MKKKQALLISLGIIIFIVIIGLVAAFIVNIRNPTITKTVPDSARLSFDQDVIIEPPDIFKMSVILDSGNQQVIGADVVINFDETNLILVDIDLPTHEIFKTFVPVVSNSSLFDELKVMELANTSGKVQIGVLAFDPVTGRTTGSFNGTLNPLIILKFQVKPSADSTIPPVDFQYIDDVSITDSNVIIQSETGHPEDILAKPTSNVNVSTKETNP